MIDLEKIRVFYHVGIEGSLLKAAKIMKTSSPAISRHISDLEHHIGVKLFVRKKKGMVLTGDGHRLFAVAKCAVSDLEKITLEMKGQFVEKDIIRIITTPGVVGYWLMHKLNPFFLKYPHIKFKIYTQDEEVNFSESQADIGFLMKVSDPENVTMRKIMKLTLYYFASPAYIKRKGIPTNQADLINHDIISFYHSRHGFVGNVDWHLKAGDMINTPRITINNALVQFSAAVEGAGLLACPENFELLRKFDFVPVLVDEIKMEIDAFMVYSSKKLLDGLLLELYQCIVT